MSEIWTAEVDQRLKELRQHYSQEATAEKLSEEFGYNYTRNAVKNREGRIPEQVESLPNYKEAVEILSDGSHKSDKLLRMSSEQAKDVEYLLKAHGFDVNAWELVNAKNNIWNVHDKINGISTLYSSKITVKPITNNEYGYKELLEEIRKQEPIIFNRAHKELEYPRLLEIAPVDTHFGISTFEDYLFNQNRIINKINSRHWEEIVIPVGNDLFHNDDFRGRTSSGREIQKVNMRDAWNDAKRFYYPIIERAIKQSNKTTIIYVRGNHDESMSWAFVDNLLTKFPEIECDLEFAEHKAHIFAGVFLGYTHGEKSRKNTASIFNTKFRMELAKAKVREIHMAHLHGEDTKDDFGIMVRTLPTANKEDEWHDQNGYVGKNKRFQVFEYSEEELESIHYV